AFLRVSGDRQVDLRREGAEGRSGSIQIEAGATVASTGALMLDASADNRIDGTLATDGGSVALGARRISLGEVDASASGLILDSLSFGAQTADHSLARCPDGTGDFELTANTTPGYANSCATGVASPDDELAGLRLYPNPADASFTVQHEGDAELRFGLYDLHGRLLLDESLGAEPLLVSTAGLPAGLLYYRVWSARTATVRSGKVVVQH
ncbi:MAG TPA: T9SS type A sorting domain-containing protein, partial [Saprospiraceae bacterium]|nr:T9SS type A sorting domain-containing protein [Saprospiraceae bacterium]